MVLFKAFNGTLSACDRFIYKIFFYGVKRMYMEESFQTNFKFPKIIRYIFNVWRKIVEDLNAHVMYSPLVYSI
jgi:hypothetical protein